MQGLSDPLIPASELRVLVGSEASDMRDIADAVARLAGRIEATLNVAVGQAEMCPRLKRDCRNGVDAITDAMAELSGFFRHAADIFDANDALPHERSDALDRSAPDASCESMISSVANASVEKQHLSRGLGWSLRAP